MTNFTIRFSAKYSCFIFAILISSYLYAQPCPSGPQVWTFHSSVDDTEQPYGLYVPPDYDPAKKYPLVVMLHGAGSNHRLALRRVFGHSNHDGETDIEASRYFPEWQPEQFLVASPYARGTMGYQGVAEKDVLDVVAAVRERFSVDENRMYLTGLSMGGGGTLWIGLSRPDMWAAIAPVCPAPPTGTEALAPNALHLPVHLFQGGADQVVRPEGVRAWVDRFKAAEVNVSYQEYPGVGHDSWVNAYKDQQIFDWFAQYERNPFPDRVRFVTEQYRHNKAYWVTIDAFTPGQLAGIDAMFRGNNKLDITTGNLQAFTLSLAGHPTYTAGQPLQVRLDGASVNTPNVGSTISFYRQSNRWIAGKPERPEQVKRPGIEGPMSDILSDRHIYVYGTAGDPSNEEMEARREQAQRAAEWSYYRGEFLGRIKVFPRVLSDKEVRPSDLESAHLILFGNRETNELIERFSDQLPMHLQDDSKRYGLAYIFPNEDRYILINSGRSILDAPESEKAIDGLSRFASPPIVYSLKKFEDYVLFDAENVVANGRFDNHWQLPAEAAQQLKASGVVRLKE